MTDEQALTILRDRRGTMYDPAVVDAFIADYRRIMPASNSTPHPASRAIGDARIQNREPRAPEPIVAIEPAISDGLLAVTSLARALSGEARVADVGALLWTSLRQVLPCEAMGIFLPDEGTDEVTVRYAAGAQAAAMKHVRKATGDGIAGWCAVNRRPAVNADPALDFGLRVSETAPSLGSCLALPLVSGEQFVGVLALYRARRNGFTEDDLRLVELLAPRVAASLDAAIDIDTDDAIVPPVPAPALKLVRTGAR
jgi:transcriptional regulator with GAF, ATPase, and Fis domain